MNREASQRLLLKGDEPVHIDLDDTLKAVNTQGFFLMFVNARKSAVVGVDLMMEKGMSGYRMNEGFPACLGHVKGMSDSLLLTLNYAFSRIWGRLRFNNQKNFLGFIP